MRGSKGLMVAALTAVVVGGCVAESPSSAGPENTLSACTDDLDNDGDGWTDCDDQDCQIYAVCVASPDAAVDANQTTDSGPQPDGAGPDADLPNCATESYVGEQQPAALMVVLDKSESMGEVSKWGQAASAITSVLDRDSFNSVYLGLYAAPTGSVAGPSCVFGLPVGCQTPASPQVGLQLAGTEKSTDPSGVRRQIADWLAMNSPTAGHDGTPLYEAIESAIAALAGWPEQGKRILIVVTDGSMSCTSLSSPLRDGFMDCNGCQDWEHPQNIIDLLAAANSDGQNPIESFIIGVPGSDTNDPSGCQYPPYQMQAALSAIAYAGSPAHVPDTCDGTAFVQSSSVPSVPCHFDMTGSYSEQELVDTIAYVRGQTMGCIFELPDPGQGNEIDLDYVNVRYAADGNSPLDIPKRSDPQDECLDPPGCWDYTDDQQHVELIGAACEAITSASDVEVGIYVGCETVVR